MKRFSKLKSRLESLMISGFSLRLGIVRMKSQYGNTDLPLYQIFFNKEKIWELTKPKYFPYETNVSDVNEWIDLYCQTPRFRLFKLDDPYGICKVLRQYDRRFK